MEVAEMRMLRWTCGKTIFDMIPNGVFRTNLQVVTIVNKKERTFLRWFGHVKRRPQSAPVRIVEELTVNGTRRRGRPKLRWEDRLKTDLKEMLSEDMTCDRSAWRSRIRVLLPLSSVRGVTVYISPPPYLASAGLGNIVVVVNRDQDLVKGVHFCIVAEQSKKFHSCFVQTLYVKGLVTVLHVKGLVLHLEEDLLWHPRFEPFVSSVVVNVAAVVVIGAAVVVIVVAVVVESLVGLAKGRPPDVGQRKLVSFTANANEQVNGKCQET
ncbi:hypothetical protein Tco_0415388 [Tanacetum coccineum]